MASTITGTTIDVIPSSTSNSMEGRVTWSYTQDLTANTSTITAVLAYRTTTGPTTSYTGTGVSNFFLTIDDETVRKTNGATIAQASGWVTILTLTKTVTHSSDGTKTVTISAGGGMPATSGLPNSSGLLTTALQQIPRGSTFGTITGTDIVGNMTISITIPTGVTNYHKLEYSFAGETAIAKTVINQTLFSGASYTWALPAEDLGAAIPNTTSGTVTLTLTSYSDSAGTTQRGDPAVKTLTLNMPNNNSTKPSVNVVTATDTAFIRGSSTVKVVSFIGSYVQGVSKPKFTTTAATGKYGAAIKSYAFTFDGVTKSGTALTQTFGVVNTAGSPECKLTVTDSRGFTSEATRSITVSAYTTPSITAQNIRRTASGTVTAKASAKTTALNNNTLQIFVAYKLSAASTYGGETELQNGTSETADGFIKLTNASATLTSIEDSSSYNFKLIAKDALATYSQEYKVGTSAVGLHIGPTWLGVGKIHERGTLDVGGNIIATPSIIATDTGKTLHDDGLRGAMLNRLGRLYLQGDSSNSPQINFYGNSSSNTSPTATIRELTDGVLTFNANIVGATGKTMKAENLPDISDEYLSAAGTKSFTLATRHTYMVICTRHGGTLDTADVRIIALGINGVNTNAPISTASFVSVSTSGTTLSVTTSETYVRVTVIDLGSYL